VKRQRVAGSSPARGAENQSHAMVTSVTIFIFPALLAGKNLSWIIQIDIDTFYTPVFCRDPPFKLP
jgi:hypothetical protein